jgi:hypothetical protein
LHFPSGAKARPDIPASGLMHGKQVAKSCVEASIFAGSVCVLRSQIRQRKSAAYV